MNLAEVYTPAQGVAAGLLDRVVAVEDLMPTATALAQRLAGLDRPAHTATKLRSRQSTLTAIRAGLEKDRAVFQQLGRPVTR